MRTLPREPWRGGQICGWQIAVGGWDGPAVFCGDRKQHNEYLCRTHLSENEGEDLRFADGNEVGELDEPVTLSWEPDEGDDPIPATDAEIKAWKESGVMTPASVLKYGDMMDKLSGTLANKPVAEYVMDLTRENNNAIADNPTPSSIMLDWWYEIITDEKGHRWRVAWLMDTTNSAGDDEGGWVFGVWWEPVEPRHTHYDPYGPPRQVLGTLLECDQANKHDAKDSELWAEYAYNPQLLPSEALGLPGHEEHDLMIAYRATRRAEMVCTVTEVVPDEEYTYRATVTNRTMYSLDEPGPTFHTEEWGIHSDGKWHAIPRNPHPGYEHLPAFCPNCGY